MADETLPGGTEADNTGDQPNPDTIDTSPKTAEGEATTADEVGSAGDATAANAGESDAAANAEAGVSDAAAMTPEAVLSTVESKPAAKVGPVIPDGPKTGGGDNRGRDNRGGGRGRGRGNDRNRRSEEDEDGIESSVIRIYRCSKVVKGGRTFSFAGLVVCGDRNGKIGIGYGKANEVPSAVEKATKEARKTLFSFPMKGSTIPHMVIGKSGSSTVKLIPARPGTGVTAGKTVRPILELAGLTDVLTKAYGSTSPKNLLKATVDALKRLQSREEVEERRGVELPKDAGELGEIAAGATSATTVTA